MSQQRVVLASGNRGKLAELQAVLADTGLQLLPQSDFAVPEALETGLSFVENAIIKARHAARHSGLAAIADDSGLCVDALDGAPGIYSARYAGPGSSDADNNDKLLRVMQDIPPGQRGARFVCALVFIRHADDPQPIICEGSWQGEILHDARGDNGFGYDPLFFIAEQNCSSAQLPSERKNRISHRGQALAQLLEKLPQALAAG